MKSSCLYGRLVQFVANSLIQKSKFVVHIINSVNYKGKYYYSKVTKTANTIERLSLNNCVCAFKCEEKDNDLFDGNRIHNSM